MIYLNIFKTQTLMRIVATIVILSVVFALLLLAGCSDKKKDLKSEKKAPLVTVEPVIKDQLVRSLDMTGEVVPIKIARISSTIEGPISFCPWREGDRVRTAQKLIEIDRPTVQTEVKMAEAALEVARAKLTDLKAGTRPEEIDKAQENVREAEENAAFTKTDLERITKLVESGALPGEEHEKARVKYIAAEAKLKVAVRQLEMLKSGFTNTTIAIQEASVKEAAAKLAMAQARLNECVISAPFFGTVTKVFVRAGDMAALKTPLLELADLSSLVVRSSVPEAYASEVQLGMMGQIRLDALPEKVFKAEVTRVFPELDQRMRTRTIELSIQEKVNLVPNLFGRVKLILKLFPDAIAIPAQAVIVNPKGDSVVFVVIDGKAIQRKIKTGIEDSGRIQVLSGMKPGEQVIVSGQEKLKDGIEIRLPGTISKGQSKNTPKEKSSSEGK